MPYEGPRCDQRGFGHLPAMTSASPTPAVERHHLPHPLLCRSLHQPRSLPLSDLGRSEPVVQEPREFPVGSSGGLQPGPAAADGDPASAAPAPHQVSPRVPAPGEGDRPAQHHHGQDRDGTDPRHARLLCFVRAHRVQGQHSAVRLPVTKPAFSQEPGLSTRPPPHHLGVADPVQQSERSRPAPTRSQVTDRVVNPWPITLSRREAGHHDDHVDHRGQQGPRPRDSPPPAGGGAHRLPGSAQY
jgi:hypothetical protein